MHEIFFTNKFQLYNKNTGITSVYNSLLYLLLGLSTFETSIILIHNFDGGFFSLISLMGYYDRSLSLFVNNISSPQYFFSVVLVPLFFVVMVLYSCNYFAVSYYLNFRDVSKLPQTSKMECFVKLVGSF